MWGGRGRGRGRAGGLAAAAAAAALWALAGGAAAQEPLPDGCGGLRRGECRRSDSCAWSPKGPKAQRCKAADHPCAAVQGGGRKRRRCESKAGCSCARQAGRCGRCELSNLDAPEDRLPEASCGKWTQRFVVELEALANKTWPTGCSHKEILSGCPTSKARPCPPAPPCPPPPQARGPSSPDPAPSRRGQTRGYAIRSTTEGAGA